MKVCLVNPPTTGDGEPLYFPFGLLALGGQLKAAGVACQVIDLDLLLRQRRLGPRRGVVRRAVDLLVRSGADLIGITTICSNFPLALVIARAVRERMPSVRIVLGGPQVSAVAPATMQAFPFIDAVVVGEGEHALVDLCESRFEPDALARVRGVVTRRNEVIIEADPAPLVSDLDTLPFPDYSLVPLDDYASVPDVGFAPTVEAGRGCPFRCTFCSTKSMWVRTFRIKSPARLLSEMEALHESTGQTYFPTIHDNFTTSKKYLEAICSYFAAHNRYGLRWGASSRPDGLDETALERLASAGCADLFFGVESASAGIQQLIRKGLKLDRFEPILRAMVARGMGATTSFILGFPEETEQDVDETVLAACRYRAAGARRVFFTQLVPLPGTELTRQYFDTLCLSSDATSISRHLRGGMGEAASRALVREHKNLFSSFYRFPTPHLVGVHLEHLAFFYKHCLACELDRTQELLFSASVPPLDLFRRWLAWMARHHPALAHYDRAWEGMTYFRRFCRQEFDIPARTPRRRRGPRVDAQGRPDALNASGTTA